MKKKILAFCIILCMLFSLVVVPVVGAVSTGKCGADVTWTLDDNGTLTISGTGEMTNYSSGPFVPWYSTRSSIKTVIIGYGVTSIGENAFFDCGVLTYVEIPKSVTVIYDAFKGCFLCSEVDYLGSQEDWNKVQLPFYDEPLTFDPSMNFLGTAKATIIDSGTCGDSLTWTLDDRGTLTIGGSGNMAKYNSYSYEAPWYSIRSSIQHIIIANNVKSIGDWAFFDCDSLTSATIGSGVTTIGDCAFCDCESLTSVTIPENMTTIGSSAFNTCISLGYIWIPSGITAIGDLAFYDCESLTSVTIPDSVASIGSAAFVDCINLTSINVSDNNSNYSSKDGVLFNEDKTELVAFPAGKGGSYIIPDGVTSIGYRSFEDCTNLTSVIISNSVTIIDRDAFWSCTNLSKITIPDSIKRIEDYAFSSCTSLTDVYYGGTVDNWSKISIYSGNNYLTNATRHYIPSISVTQDVNTFTVTPKNLEIGNSVILAAYKNGQVIDIKTEEYDGTAAEFTVTGEYDSIKVMLWSSLKDMIPLATAKKQ